MSDSATSPAASVDDAEELFENAPCGYITLGADHCIARVNRTFLNWAGFTAEQMTGKRLHEFLNMAGRIYYETHIAPLLRMQGSFNEFALDFIDAEERRLPVIANAAEVRDSSGKVLSIRIAMIQATDRRRYERELVNARTAVTNELRAAQETAVLREQFVAVLSHDLRNPLAALSSGARLMLKAGSKEQAEKLEAMMQASVRRMGNLIDNVMDFARGRLGSGIIVDLSAGGSVEPMLAQVIAELQANHPDRTIQTDFAITSAVRCDPLRIAQMFSNLLGNAITHGARDRPIKVGAKTSVNTFELYVANEGKKIAAETMKHLFQPYYRGSIQPSMQGLGLGLYIASEIAHAHNGNLEVSSDDHETRFTFRMPF